MYNLEKKLRRISCVRLPTTSKWSSGKDNRLCHLPGVVQVVQKLFCDLKIVEFKLYKLEEKIR